MVNEGELKKSNRYIWDQEPRIENPKTLEPLDTPLLHLTEDWLTCTVRRYDQGSDFVLNARVVGSYTSEREKDGSILTANFFTADGMKIESTPEGFFVSAAVGPFVYAAFNKTSNSLQARVRMPKDAEYCQLRLRSWLKAREPIFLDPILEISSTAQESNSGILNLPSLIDSIKPDINLRFSRVIRSALTFLDHGLPDDNNGKNTGNLKNAAEALYLYALSETLVEGNGQGALKDLKNFVRIVEKTNTNFNKTSVRKLARKLITAGEFSMATGLLEKLDPEHPRLPTMQGWLRLRDNEYKVDTRPISRTEIAKSRVLPETLSKNLTGLYVLQSALPHQSNGYAIRAQGLLEAYKRAGLNMVPVTQYGYPLDRSNGTFDGEDTYTTNGITYHFTADRSCNLRHLPADDFLQISARYIERMASEHRVDFIKSASFFTNGLPAVSAARNLNIPLVYEMRGMAWLTRSATNPNWMYSEEGRLMRDAEVAAAKQADHVFAITSALKTFLVESGVEENKISLLPNAIDANAEDEMLPRDDKLAKKLGVDGAFVFGYLGSFVDYEGIDLLIKAFEDTDFSQPTKLLLVGDGPEYSKISGLASQSRRAADIVLTGRVSHFDVGSYYSLFDVAHIPRLPFKVCTIISPLKPFELFRMDMPVIASDVAAIDEVLGSGERGRVFRAGDAQDLGRCMLDAMHDRAASREMSSRAKIWVNSERTWDRVVKSAVCSIKDMV